MKHSYLNCPSCGDEVTSLTRVCRCGHVFQAARLSGKTVRLHHVILAACRAVCLALALISPLAYGLAAVQSGKLLLFIVGPVTSLFLLGSFYIFKAVEIILDREG